jgi:hypothetical protein
MFVGKQRNMSQGIVPNHLSLRSVFSSFPTTRRSHAFLNGTSMATSHVTGIVALWIEKYFGLDAVRNLYS